MSARCVCNGYSSTCSIANDGSYTCACQGNTCGSKCEECCPLFNQQPYQPSLSSAQIACEECNCNGQATSCVYDSSVDAANQSLNTNGIFSGGGVCACVNDSGGVNCRECEVLFFLPEGLQFSTSQCEPCNCNDQGSRRVSNVVYLDCLREATMGMAVGDCYCKTNVEGSKCDVCEDEHYNLSASNANGCQPCDCHRPGTVGASNLCSKDMNGQCPCKNFTTGRRCDECKDKFFNLEMGNTLGCTPCDCNGGASLNEVCNKVDGKCDCISHVTDRQCTRQGVDFGFYFRGVHAIFTEGESQAQTWRFSSSEFDGFSGRGYAVLSLGDSLSLTLDIPIDTEYDILVRYLSSVGTPTLTGQIARGTESHSLSLVSTTNLFGRLGRVNLSSQGTYDVTLNVINLGGEILIVSVLSSGFGSSQIPFSKIAFVLRRSRKTPLFLAWDRMQTTIVKYFVVSIIFLPSRGCISLGLEMMEDIVENIKNLVLHQQDHDSKTFFLFGSFWVYIISRASKIFIVKTTRF